MTLSDYEAWLRSARPGATRPYHYGELARDRGHYVLNPYKFDMRGAGQGAQLSHWDWVPLEPLNTLAARIFGDAELGYVLLTQTRVEGRGNAFEYRMTRTAREVEG